MAKPKIIIKKQWIASCNAEWMAYAKGFGQVRGGGSPATAISAFAERHPDFFAEGVTVTVAVEPDTTIEQVRRANAAFFGASR